MLCFMFICQWCILSLLFCHFLSQRLAFQTCISTGSGCPFLHSWRCGLLVGAQRLSLLYGRPQVSVACKVVGICLLLSMVFTYQVLHDEERSSSDTQNHDHWLIVMWPFMWWICYKCLFECHWSFNTQPHYGSCSEQRTSSMERFRIHQHFRLVWSCRFGRNCCLDVSGKYPWFLFFTTALLQAVGFLPLVALFGIDESSTDMRSTQD